ncbi:MAG: CHAD domain-containing protein [Opitutaceae bacterium]|nr:CHAD domain-containing protein [Opitutaceae bacterium]
MACVDAAQEAMDSAAEKPNRAAHLVRREMKRLRALVQLAPKPRPDWMGQVASSAGSIHRELGELRDGCVVAATLEKVRARHPRRWKELLPVRAPAEVLGSGKSATACAVARGRLEELRTLIASAGRKFGSDAELGEALARSYRKARRARAIVPTAIDQEAVHAWRKAMYRLCFQLQLAAPLLTREASKIEPGLAPLAKKLGRCGDLAMARERLAEREMAGVKALTRAKLLEWLGTRRQKNAHEILAATAEYFERRPRDFAKWCLRRKP